MDNRHRTIAAPGVGAEAARATVLRVLGDCTGLEVHEVASGRISVARGTRPRWALIACAATFWLLGLGFLFLLVRHTESGEVGISDGPRGCVVTVPPVVGAPAARALEAALGSRTEEVAPVAASSSPRPRPPVDLGLDDRTVARRAVDGPGPGPEGERGAPRLVLRFAAGEVAVEAGSHLVLGRDPSAVAVGPSRGQGPPSAQLVPADPADLATVSKSHLLVAFDGTRATAEDLGSTNGSTRVRAGITEVLTAGAPADLAEGDELRLGAAACCVQLLGG